MKVFSILSVVIAFSFTMARTQAITECNGYAELCDKPYSSMTFVATHNSYESDIVQQLRAGVRALMLDGHNDPVSSSNPIRLCHSDCSLFDYGRVDDTLKNVTTFLEQNPNEVITIFWENQDKIDPLEYKTAYDTAGLTQYAYIPPSPTEWPTLRSLIQNNTRVINFIDTGANNQTVPWLLSEYTYVFETPFANYDLNTWQCTVDRPKDHTPPMYLLNHFLYQTINLGGSIVDAADTEKANITNGINLKQHAENCTKIFGKIPNYLAVDAYEKGSDGVNVFSVAAGFNNVTYVPVIQSTDDGEKNLGSGLSVNLELSFVTLIGAVTFAILRW